MRPPRVAVLTVDPAGSRKYGKQRVFAVSSDDEIPTPVVAHTGCVKVASVVATASTWGLAGRGEGGRESPVVGLVADEPCRVEGW